MDHTVIIGLGYAILAGVFAGSFSLPMKFTTDWKWQHNWLAYSAWATAIMPLIFAFFTVPDLFSVYQQSDSSAVLKVLLYGMAWGVGSICFGLGLEYLGVALGMSIMLGLLITVGSITTLPKGALSTPKGAEILVALAMLAMGIVICGIAGSMRDKIKKLTEKTDGKEKTSTFKKGLIIAILAGVLGPMLAKGFDSGISIKELAIQAGATSLFAGNAVWPIALFGGFIINFLYCAYLINKDKEGDLFGTKKRWNWILTAASGVIWFFCMMFFGMASDKLGALGVSVGWASFQTIAIVAGNMVGLFTGEWKNTGSKPLVINFIGIAVLLTGIFVMAF
jgi:L-rhamnose-H+ transport protein